MGIRDKEEELFSEWKLKYQHSTFLIDGCPAPAEYLRSRRKAVFVLKEANLGKGNPGDVYDQRSELEDAPADWWCVIARWAYLLEHPEKSWDDAFSGTQTQSQLKEKLRKSCYLQLKKSWGGGSSSDKELTNTAKDDIEFIRSQLAIYEPNYIIACGTGKYLQSVMRCAPEKVFRTKSGVPYWRVAFNGQESFLINYCHPTSRLANSVKGVVAKGLQEAVDEIEKIV